MLYLVLILGKALPELETNQSSGIFLPVHGLSWDSRVRDIESSEPSPRSYKSSSYFDGCGWPNGIYWRIGLSDGGESSRDVDGWS